MEIITLLYQNNETGVVYDLTQLTSDISLDTQQNSCSELTVTLLFDKKIPFAMGGSCNFKVGKVGMFFGTLFDVKVSDAHSITLIFRDQLTYLNTQESYTFPSTTTTEVIKALANDFNLRLGQLANINYKHEAMIFDNKKLLDIIAKYVSDLIRKTGEYYTFQDVYGSLTLRNVKDNVIPFIIGDESLASGFSYDRSISDSKNEIKLIQENSDTKERRAYIYKDSNNIKKWGRLLEVQTIDEKLPQSIISDYGRALLGLKNKESKKLTFSDALGNTSFLGGRSAYVSLQVIGVKGLYIIESARHSWIGGVHKMNVTLSIA